MSLFTEDRKAATYATISGGLVDAKERELKDLQGQLADARHRIGEYKRAGNDTSATEQERRASRLSSQVFRLNNELAGLRGNALADAREADPLTAYQADQYEANANGAAA